MDKNIKKKLNKLELSLMIGGILSKLIYLGWFVVGLKFIRESFEKHEMYSFILITFLILMMLGLKIIKDDEVYFIDEKKLIAGCETVEKQTTINS